MRISDWSSDVCSSDLDAGDVLVELILERRRPRHELEAEAVVDHRDATGREVEALTIDAGDMLARRSLQMRQASVGREPRRGGVEVATAQGIQEIALQEGYKTSSTTVAAPAPIARKYGGSKGEREHDGEGKRG